MNIIFFTITWRTTSMVNSVLKNIASCYQNRNPSQTFCRENCTLKHLKKLSLAESLFNICIKGWNMVKNVFLVEVTQQWKHKNQTELLFTAQNSTKLRHRWFHEGVLISWGCFSALRVFETLDITSTVDLLFIRRKC